MESQPQNAEFKFQWKVSLKIPNSGIILKIFTHGKQGSKAVVLLLLIHCLTLSFMNINARLHPL